MVKDAYYFSHDANARNDPKLLAIRMKYGMRGYGIFFGIIEIMRESNGYELLNDCSTIAYDLREPNDDVLDIIKNYGLFCFEGDKFYSLSLIKRMEEMERTRQVRSAAGRAGGLASASKRQANVDVGLSSKVKESKGKESKTLAFDFASLWAKYPKKLKMKEAKRHFEATVKTEEDYANINIALNKFLASSICKGNVQYIPYGSTWFNNWQDWVHYKEPNSGGMVLT